MINHVWTFSDEHGAQSICETCNRIAAFGAIRRAAEVARACERIADTRPYNAAGKSALRSRANAIRRAIRAAIGSPKA